MEPEPSEPDDSGGTEPGPSEPDDSGESSVEVIQKALTNYGYNSGYGYTDRFCYAWGETLPDDLVYESSNPDVVVINAEGQFTTLSAGTAVLTASDADRRYELTVEVQDRFQWSYTLLDGRVYLDIGKEFHISGYSWMSGTRPKSGKWTSSDPSVAKMYDLGVDFWDRCRVVGVSEGTATITGVITFEVDTAAGTTVTLEDTVSFQVDSCT